MSDYMYNYPWAVDPKYKALGAHIFAGGFGLGMRTKFEILAHLEGAGGFGMRTVQHNFPGLEVVKDYKDWHAERFAGMADVVYGNPPCAAFSPVGRSMRRGRDNWKTDERMELSRQMNTLLGIVKPKIWIHECVPQIMTYGKEYSEHVAKMAMDQGYAVTFLKHDGKLLGMPMQRRRVFTIAHKVKLKIHHPPCQRLDAGFVFDTFEGRWPEHYFPLTGERLEYVRMIRSGEAKDFAEAYAKRHPGETKGRPRMFEAIMSPDLPSGSIAGQGPVAVHPWAERYIAPREIAMICGYPPDYIWPDLSWADRADDITQRQRDGTAIEAMNQMVRAVTPPAGKYAAEILFNSLEANEPIDRVQARVVERWAPSPRLTDYRLSTKEYDFMSYVPSAAEMAETADED